MQALYVVTLPLLTRLYSVPQLGDLAVFQALLAILLVVSALRYDVAVFVPADDRTAAGVLSAGLLAVLAVSLAAAVGLGALSWSGWLPAHWARVAQAWPLLGIGLAAAGVALVLSQWSLRRRAFADVARSRVSQVGSQVAAQLAAGLLWPAGVGLLVGDVIGRAAGAVVLGRAVLRSDTRAFEGIRPPDVRKAARGYISYPLYSAPGALLNTATLQLPPILLVSMFGQQVAGWFGLMIRVVSAPMMLVGKSVGDAYASEFARLQQDDPAGIPRLFAKTFRRLALVGLGPLVVILVAGPLLFQFVFGQEWREAGQYARLAAFYTYAEFCCFPLFLTLNLLQKPRVQLAWDAALVALLAIGFGTLWINGAGPRAAVLYYGIVFGAMYFVHVAVSYRLLMQQSTRPVVVKRHVVASDLSRTRHGAD